MVKVKETDIIAVLSTFVTFLNQASMIETLLIQKLFLT